MGTGSLTMMAVGDLILSMPEPESYFKFVAPVLRSGDVVIGHGEIPYTTRPVRTSDTISAQDPDSMRGLTFAGFNVITLAGNHMWDAGVPGIEDTIAWLRNNGIAYVGAGMNINEARRPAVIERKETKVGVLSL